MPHNDPFAGATIDADWAYGLSRATTYTPELTASTTDPNLGADGAISGWYHRNGHLVTGGVDLNFAGTGVSAGSGEYHISLPLAADASILDISNSVGRGGQLGIAYLRDFSTPANYTVAAVQIRTTSDVFIVLSGTSSAVGASSPFAFGDNDEIHLTFAYPADSSVL